MLVSDKDRDVYGASVCGCIGESYNWPVTDSAGCDHVIHRIRTILARSKWLTCDQCRYGCITAELYVDRDWET